MSKKAKYELLMLTPEGAKHFTNEIGIRLESFSGGITLYPYGKSSIVIDSELPPKLQRVILAHEEAQLEVIQTSPQPFSSICRVAHQAGIAAALDKARKPGVYRDYLKYRGVKREEDIH